MTTLAVDTWERDQRCQENRDLPEEVADYLCSRNTDLLAYREDMIGAGNLALVEAAARFAGDRFRPYARGCVRRVMKKEVRKLSDTHRPGSYRRGETRPTKLRELVNLDAPLPGGQYVRDDLPCSHDTEDRILDRIDRQRAMDGGWRKRERRLEEDPVTAHRRLSRLTSIARVVWKMRRVKSRSLTETARSLGLPPKQVRTIERRAVRIVTGERESLHNTP